MKKFIIVAGVAGSGKTYIGKEICCKIENSIYIDKDTQTRDIVDSYLVCLGRDATDRESNEYLEKVRPKEYECLIKQGLENVELNKSCVVSAPFMKEVNDNDFFRNLVDDLDFEDATIRLIWVMTDEDSARKRLIDRNARRDDNKINNWSSYVQKTDHDFVPNLDFEIFIIENTMNPNKQISLQIEDALNYINRDFNED
jgi:adenylate kinase family enzyme